MDNTKSPLAPASPIHLVDRIQVANLIGTWQNLFGIDISSELKGISEISLYRCQASQLDFFAPLSAAGSERLYADLCRFDWYYMADKWEFEQAIRDISGCRRILEVGCGPGFFVERIGRQLPGSVVKGIELSEWAIQQAWAKSLPVEAVDLRHLVSTGECFDAVCSFQVLEHVSDPYNFLAEMVQLLKPKGRLILSVPNQESFLQHEHTPLDMPPHHMTRWRPFTLGYLENLFPLKKRRLSFEPLAQYHISGYVAAYAQYWRVKWPVLRFLLSERRLCQISNLLKSGWHRFLRGQTLYALFEKL